MYILQSDSILHIEVYAAIILYSIRVTPLRMHLDKCTAPIR